MFKIQGQKLMLEEYFSAKIELDYFCSIMQRDQVIFWKNKQLEAYMDEVPVETVQECINRIARENPKLAISALQSSYMIIYKKLPTENDLFDVWFQENQESDELQTEYGDHRLELIQIGQDNISFRDWAREKFSALLETHQINLESLNVDRFLDNK